jgi:RcsF protein
MRVLPLCFLTVLLAGCTAQHKAAPVAPQPVAPEVLKPVKPRPAPAHSAPVKLYKNAEALLGTPFRDLGEVSGESCQANSHSSPASIRHAQKKMLVRASKMKANAVLLHQCQMLSQASHCYQEAICRGSALNVSFK